MNCNELWFRSFISHIQVSLFTEFAVMKHVVFRQPWSQRDGFHLFMLCIPFAIHDIHRDLILIPYLFSDASNNWCTNIKEKHKWWPSPKEHRMPEKTLLWDGNVWSWKWETKFCPETIPLDNWIVSTTKSNLNL